MTEKKKFPIEVGIPIQKYGDKGGRARWETSHEFEIQQRLEPKYKAWITEKRRLDKRARISRAQLEFDEARWVAEKTLWKWMLVWDKELASISCPNDR